MHLTRRACVHALFASSLPAWRMRGFSQAAAVEEVEETWVDSVRQRELPVRTRWPDAARFAGERPVVIFSHGLGGTVGGGAVWGEAWAAAGFAVLHLQHPGSDLWEQI